MSELALELIAAVAANGVIGRGGQLPWHLPDDLRHFKTLTMGHAMIMGRRTYESIGKPLPGRMSIVVTRSLAEPPHEGVKLARNLESAVALACEMPSPAVVIGGATLYAAALPRVTALHLTELDEAVEGDTYFPEFDRSNWQIIEETDHPRDPAHSYSYHLRKYVRI